MTDLKARTRRWRSLTVTAFSLVAFWVLLGFSARRANVQAQSGSGWSPHRLLYGGSVRSHMTTLASDPFGSAHMVWKIADKETYYYSRWNGTGWTRPIDVVATTAEVGLAPPALVAAADGSLHLFWAREYIMHSWAWADDAAHSARAWSDPQPVLFPTGSARDALDVRQDRFGVFHLVYPAGHDIYYVHSDDKGLTWTKPTVVRRASDGTRMSAPRLDIGPDGRVHVTWEEWPLDRELFESAEVYYAHTDDGINWSEPRQLGELANRNTNVLAAADGTVYLAWQAGIVSPNSGRFLQRSTDGGDTWDIPVNFSDVKGQSGYPSMALDSQSTLHIITGDGEYAFWNGRSLSAPLDMRPVPEQTENARLTVVNGNQVLVVIGPFDGPGLYYTVKGLPLPAVPTSVASKRTSDRATPTPTAAAERTVVAAASTAGTAFPDSSAFPSDRPSSSSTSILLLSGGLSLILATGVLTVEFARRRR